jgi:two-component system heavy metal sensor histidine kinase CusS
MLWNAGAVAATGLLILLAVRAFVRPTLIADLDDVLGEDLKEITLQFADNHPYDWPTVTEELDRKAEGHQFHRWFVQFYDAEDEPTWSSRNTPELPPLSTEQKRQKAFSVNDHRVSFLRLDRPIKEGAALCVGCSQRYISRDMETIDKLVASAGLIVLLVSPLVGHLLTSRTIQPLAEMIRTTARLHPGEFGERLPIRGTGDELDSLAHTINGLLDRIATYLQQEHDFLANAAHDLRTPLAAIRSSVEVALGVKRTDEEYREILGLVIEQCSSLQMLVNQLLLLAETDADRLQTDVEPVQLDQLVAKAAEMFEGVADDHEIELHLGELPAVSVPGNRHHLRQVVNNLLDNSIKFTAARGSEQSAQSSASEQKGVIFLELKRDEANHFAHLRVEDNGIGIAPDDQPHVFDRFFRADKSRGRDGAAGGTGLGLSICKAIVEAHGGTISVQSQPGRGSIFVVSLPLDASAPTANSEIGEPVLDPLEMP